MNKKRTKKETELCESVVTTIILSTVTVLTKVICDIFVSKTTKQGDHKNGKDSGVFFK
jgi:hypothetical protein